jgi:hypothetical protein
MATELFMRRKLGSLWPIDDEGREVLQGLPTDADVRVTIKRARNVQFHRLFFGLLNLVAQSGGPYDSADQLLTVVKIGIGHVDGIIMPDGSMAWHPRSISFAKMDETEFRAFYDRAVDFIVKQVMPGTEESALRAEVEAFVYGA